ncbi:MAG: SPFH domain-containing protein [Candidatus Poseidoniaceae archaeon]|nr:SPFH domain-containing protein [Candidatus Poseidoniaceae archaeon]
MAGELLLIGLFLFVFALVVTLYVATSRYKLAPSDQILVVYGNVKNKQSAECIHGGGKIVWPLIQHYAYLSLRPMTISISLKHALSKQNIRINVPSSFTIGISTEPSIMNNAATRLLGLPPTDIEKLAEDIIFGQLRLTVASLTIEQINQDRDSFLRIVFTNVDTELHKVGLYLINVNVVDITDEREYIESIGTKAAETAVNEAMVETARARSTGELGRAEADRQREVGVAQNAAESEKGQKEAEVNRRIFVMQQEAMGKQGENVAAAEIADFEADLLVKQADARKRAEVAQRVAQKEIESAQYELEGERLRALEVVREEVSKKTVEIAAEAEAERQRRIARGQADATLARYKAEAEGTQAVLEAKATGYAQLVKSAGGDAKAAATLLMVEKIEELVARQTEAISNLKIDKITVWDSGNGGNNGEGGSTSNFISSLMQSLPPVHDVAKMAGIELPAYLGELKED